MKKITIFSLLICSIYLVSGQEIIGLIKAGDRFQNPYDFNLFYMPRSKVIEFKNLETRSEFDSLRIVLFQEKLKTYEERIFLADSATQLRKLEANFWHDKLLSNDMLLEEEKKTNVKLRADLDRVRQSRIYYFVGGIIATSIVIGVLN
ncbi:MAG: hypothetical protein ABJG47_03910 [Ekhidna sp.]